MDKSRTITIYLSNTTEVTANWTLNYVKFPKKQTVSKYTTTQWEEENLSKLDDPSVFEFSDANVSISLPLECAGDVNLCRLFRIGSPEGQVAASAQDPRRPVQAAGA